MESRDMVFNDAYVLPDSRSRRAAPLSLDPSPFPGRVGDDSAQSSPSSTPAPNSPVAAHTNRPNSRGSDSLEPDDEKEPASGPQRSRSTSSMKSDKEKRKRSRVTPEQLVHLERFFSVDRSPTAARRREISELLGMQERQTQIWFQNRRAKAKLQDGKHKGRSGSAETPPDTPPELSTGFEVDLHNLIHEDEPVTIIPCTDLSVGTWRRIATTVGKHDLVAYVCDVKRCLTWFIHSGGFGFKMEIPFDSIVDTEFTNAAPGSGLASFMLSRPPIFYLENVSSPNSDGITTRHWKRCADWTEGHQATHVLRHDLIGSAVQLAHLLRNLHANTGSDITLHSPSYRADPPAASPMELPAPPMAGLTGPGYHYSSNSYESPPPDRRNQPQPRDRRFAGAGLTTQGSNNIYPGDGDLRPPPHSAPAGSFSHSGYPGLVNRGAQSSPAYVAPIYGDYPESQQHSIPQAPSIANYAGVAISHGLAPRPYSAQPVPRAFYNDDPRLVQPYHTDAGRPPHSAADPSQQYEHGTPSPPLLTTPYHPPSRLTDNSTNGRSDNPNSASPPIMTGMPGLMYKPDQDIHLRREE